jgi:hypothetical protein
MLPGKINSWKMAHLSPALPVMEIASRLEDCDFSQRDIRALLHESDFIHQLYRNHQLCFLDAWCIKVLGFQLCTSQLAFIFNMNETTVRRSRKNGPQDPVPPGRHAALDEERENFLIAYIHERHEQLQAVTEKELLLFAKEKFNETLTKGWVHAFLYRHRDEIHLCRSLPQEDTRLVIPREYLERHIQTMKDLIHGKASELFFNLDEVGSADWEDRKPKKVIVPIAVPEEDVYHPVSRKYKHMSLLACVSAAGDSLAPLVVSAAPIPDSLWANGLRADEDVLIRHRSPPYVDESTFFEYITHVLIPYVNSVRENPDLYNEYAVLLMDSASPHVSERVLRVLGENRIMAIVFPAHTTHLFQGLDLVLFGALKTVKKTTHGDFGEDSVREQITKLLQAYEQVSTSFTIRGSFRKAGFVPDVRSKPIRINFNEEILRENPGFSEIWNLNVSVDQLSRRRQSHRFGLLNADFLARPPDE